MRIFTPIMAAMALLAGAPALQAETAVERGEKRLARMLGDRVAGAPVQCFAVREGTNAIAIDGDAVVYDLGEIIYVGRPVNTLDARDTIRGQQRGGRWRTAASPVCATDTFHTVSRLHGQAAGHADIREFVPYTRRR